MSAVRGSKAVLVGATGLVGSQLLSQLLEDAHFSSVVVLGRRPVERSHAKLQEHVIDFDTPGAWGHLVQGDVLFSALGTTLKTAGSQAAQWWPIPCSSTSGGPPPRRSNPTSTAPLTRPPTGGMPSR